MKSLIIIPILVVLSFVGCSQNNDNSFENFKLLFPVISLPYLTSNLNRYAVYDSLSRVTKLREDLCLKYFFSGDMRKVSYLYESFNMETGEKTGAKEYNYSFYPAFRAVTSNLEIFGFLRDDMNDFRYFTALFAKGKSELVDLIEINRVNEELMPDLFQYSFIQNDLTIMSIKFEINPDYFKEIKTKDKSLVFKTLITFRAHKLDLNEGRYRLTKSDSLKSNCTVDEFRNSKNDCVVPFKFD